VDGFISTVESIREFYVEHPDHRAALVEKIASVIEQAFASHPRTAEDFTA
jgi:hypothetical protein